MRDVEQARVLTGPQMFLDDAVAVLHRHIVTGEGHQPCAGRDMGRVERCLLQKVGQQAGSGTMAGMLPAESA